MSTVTLELSTRTTTTDDRPTEVGLVGPDGQELDAPWYQRQFYADVVRWQVWTAEPWAGGRWEVAAALVVLPGGRTRRERLRHPVTLCGPLDPGPLTDKQVAFRRKRGMPLQPDPHRGDLLELTRRRSQKGR